MKRGIIFILCLFLQSLAWSVEFAGGTGEPDDPYQIATAMQLIALGSDPNLLDKHFILVSDIDLDPFLPGGCVFEDALIAPDSSDDVSGHSGSSFQGVLDGQGHTIANLHITGQYGFDAALFGKLDGLVMDLNLTDVVVSGSPCGAIAGLNHGGMILRCSVTGQVSGVEDVGGLVGSLWDASIIDCRSEVQVFGEENVGGMVGGGPGGTLIGCESFAKVKGERSVGGLVGDSHDGQILECRSLGVVIGSDLVGGLIGNADETMIWMSSADCDVTAERTAGGLAGRVVWGNGTSIVDCYARGSIAGSVIGGLVGDTQRTQFVHCYAACEMFPVHAEGERLLVGGLFADVRTPAWAPTTVACFWDIELSQIVIGANTHTEELNLGTGLTTEQMLSRRIFENAGWDVDTVWAICEGDYPTLQWETLECDDP
ncbi:MAG: hypothetical protein JXM79_09710 [Sedimentisphaerales bacterium]|nr:hypothetical protein [Sedimentisphaerales bacterium]